MKKLYYDDVYLKEWESEIVEVIETEGRFLVALAETAFYPESGGQPGDRGTINKIKVIDTIEEKDIIYHVLETSPEGVGTKAFCELDFDRRYDLMQQHTGQHLLSSVFYNLFKGETSSFHIGDDYISIDISISDMPYEMVKEVELLVNEQIFKNIDIITHVVNYNQIGEYNLRKVPKAKEDIRIVEIDKIDFSPCCGTHVRKTGEIGIIKILKTEKYKGVTRVYFKCGKRALFDFQNKTEMLSKLGKYLSLPESEIFSRVEYENTVIKAMGKEILELKEKLYEYEGSNIINEANSEIISIIFEDRPFTEVVALGKKILEKGDYMLVLASSVDFKLLLRHNGNFDMNCGKFLKENLSTYGGRGGGSPKDAQAQFKDIEDIKSFIDFALKSV